MKKQLLLLIFVLILSNHSFAQFTLDWMQDENEYNKTATMMATDSQDNLIVTGYLTNQNIYTRKYDINGNVLWEVSDASGIQSNYQRPYWTTCDANDNVFVIGYRYTGTGSTQYIDAIVVLKYSPSGALLWKKNIQHSIYVSYGGGTLRATTDSEGNLYIGARPTVPTGMTLHKIAPDGTTIYSNTYNGDNDGNFSSMKIKGNTAIMVGGRAVNQTVIIARDVTTGNVTWTSNVPGFVGVDIEIDETGNSYVLSSTYQDTTLYTGSNLLLYKFSPNGTQLWVQNFNFAPTENPTRLKLAGNRLTAISWYANGSYINWRTFQVDTDGNLLWNTVYDGTPYNDEYPYNLTANANGEVIVTGRGGPSPSATNLSYLQMVILKYSNTGVQQWIDFPNIYGGDGIACDFASDNSLYAISTHNMTAYHYNPTALSTTEIANENLFSVAPNPFENTVNVQLNEVTKATVFDVTGKAVLHFDLNVENNTMDLSELNSGIYFCKFDTDNLTKTIKLVKK